MHQIDYPASAFTALAPAAALRRFVGHQFARPISAASAGTVMVRTTNVSINRSCADDETDLQHRGHTAEHQPEHRGREDDACRGDHTARRMDGPNDPGADAIAGLFPDAADQQQVVVRTDRDQHDEGGGRHIPVDVLVAAGTGRRQPPIPTPTDTKSPRRQSNTAVQRLHEAGRPG